MKHNELTQKYANLKRKYKGKIILNPLQTAGRLTEEAKQALIEFGDGYSVCDHCKGRLDTIKNPPIYDFVFEDLPEFLGADATRITHGAREGKFLVMNAITNPGDTIIVDSNKHYSSAIAAQRANLNIVEVPSEGLEKRINVEDYIPIIKQHRPQLILLTYPDGSYGNKANAQRLGEICQEYEVPFLLNAAYTIGRTPINMKEFHADFIVGSGQKSMAACGPIGILGLTEKWASILLRESKSFKGKEIECLGCSVRGAPLITMMASFPHVVQRVNNWDEEVAKAQWFISELDKLGLNLIGERPHNHDLMMFETNLFYKISQVHTKKRAFLTHELKKEGIVGLKHGLTKSMKISTYETPKSDLEKVIAVFRYIIDEYKHQI